VRSQGLKKIFRKLKERDRKSDLRWELAKIIVRVAVERQYAIVLERLGKNPAREMTSYATGYTKRALEGSRGLLRRRLESMVFQ